LTVGLTNLRRISANGFAASADAVATTAMPPVAITVPGLGSPEMICWGKGTFSVS
jgi:hypothetical protein